MKKAEENYAFAQMMLVLSQNAEAEVLRLRSEAEQSFMLMTAERDNALQALRTSQEQLELRRHLSESADVEDYVSQEHGRMQAMSNQLDVAAASIVGLQHEISIRDDALEEMNAAFAACKQDGVTLVV